NNPLITLAEANAVREFSPAVAAVAAQAQRRGTVTYLDQVLENIQVQGGKRECIDFATFDAERGRMMTPAEVDRNRPVALLGWDVADQLFGDVSPIDKVIRIQGGHFRVVGVGARNGGGV